VSTIAIISINQFRCTYVERDRERKREREDEEKEEKRETSVRRRDYFEVQCIKKMKHALVSSNLAKANLAYF
jgi:hypothetical protein